jgi:hypothetical protein
VFLSGTADADEKEENVEVVVTGERGGGQGE